MENIDLNSSCQIRLLTNRNFDDVGILCKKCSDYYILHEGVLPSEKQINEIFFTLPSDKSPKDKFVLGIYKNSELIGVVDIIKDYPTAEEWMIGLLLIAPEERANGLGKVVHEALIDWAKGLGAKSFRVAVIVENIMGMNFWAALGYEKVKEVQMELTAKIHVVDVMRYIFETDKEIK